MKYGKVNFGQMEAFINKIGGEEVFKKVLNGTAKFQITMEQFLESLGIIDIAPVNETNRDKFFTTGHNGTAKMWLSDNFKSIFLPLVSKTINYAGGKLEKLKLTKNRNDFQIRDERGDIIIQTADAIAGQIISMISKQPNGEAGELLNNGYANLLYYLDGEGRLCYVRVWWRAGDREWSCDAFVALSNEWREGLLAFSPATQDAEKLES
jgi:hypothetical protein